MSFQTSAETKGFLNLHLTPVIEKGVKILDYTLLSSHTSLMRDNLSLSLREKHCKESSLYARQHNGHKINAVRGEMLFL